uniref:Uncharacterized protein n=1 Tax=Astyanax mexicanus TaxID=7994 RepID=W5L0C9_ASTMX
SSFRSFGCRDIIYFCCCVSGSAAVAFMSYSNMENMLKPSFFKTTDNDTVKTMMSTVVSATLPKTSDTRLTKPVNFTMKHIEETDPNGTLSCVYWKNTEWVVDGCYLVETNSTHTVCSCVHLSTFALIMQTKPLMLGTVLVSVGLVFLSFTLLTFTVCRRHLRMNNTPRINLCISLLLAHLIFLLTQNLINYIQPLEVMLAGVLHFFFLSAFVWMLIEAVLLFISVKNLTKIRSKQKEVLGWKCLIIIGYVIPLVVVGVSVGSLFPLYRCWIKMDRDFIWSFVGPVSLILAVSSDIVFYLSAILGCPWILGFFTEGNPVLEMVFLFLNSQQGTFIFLVYCVLNQEVKQYRKWASCCVSK